MRCFQQTFKILGGAINAILLCFVVLFTNICKVVFIFREKVYPNFTLDATVFYALFRERFFVYLDSAHVVSYKGRLSRLAGFTKLNSGVTG